MHRVVRSPNISLRWRHNERDSVSNHQPHDCLLNRLFRRRSKKTSKLRVIGLSAGNSPGPVNSPPKWPVTLKVLICVSYELRMKYIWKSWPLRYFTHNYIWISYEVHMNFTWNTYVTETFYSYELHKNFIRTSYEFRRKYTRIIR